MSGIRWRSVVLAGLLAGVSVTISGVVLGHVVLGSEYVTRFGEHTPDRPLIITMSMLVGVRLLFGMVIVFVYAGFRPRFGSGPRTALIAGTTMFVGVYVPLTISLIQFDILTGWRVPVALIWGWAEFCVGALLGGWVYREGAGSP